MKYFEKGVRLPLSLASDAGFGDGSFAARNAKNILCLDRCVFCGRKGIDENAHFLEGGMVNFSGFLKRRRRRLATGLATCVLAMAASACNGSGTGTDMNATNELNQANVLPEGVEPLRNLNPTPKRAYGIRVLLKDPPGPFAEIDAAAQYEVSNAAECGEPQPLSGAIPRISTNEAVKLTRVSDTEFAGTVFVDQVLDEDYYGRGVCRWEFIEARVSLRESSDPMATSFVAALEADVIEQGGSKRTFFWGGHYPKAEIDNYAEFGDPSLDNVPDAQKSEFFVIEISAQQAQP